MINISNYINYQSGLLYNSVLNVSRQKKYLYVFAFLLLLTSCTPGVRFSSMHGGFNRGTGFSGNSKSINANLSDDNSTKAETGSKFRGMASYYGTKFEGNATASGEIYNPDEYTAAHRTLNFGTKVKVTNLKNNKIVIVVINDRGPYADGRIIDLSRAAAEKLDMIRDGVTDVEVEVID